MTDEKTSHPAARDPHPPAAPKPPAAVSAKPLVAAPLAPAQLAPAQLAPAQLAPAQLAKEIGGAPGPDPTRYGDWQHKGRVTDF